MREQVCSVCGKPVSVCSPSSHRETGGLTVAKIDKESKNIMANREVLISKERVYVSADGTKRIDPLTESGKLLVAQGGEIEAAVAGYFGVETETVTAVSVVTPLVEEAYNERQKVGQANPEKALRESLIRDVDRDALTHGGGVSHQVSMLGDALVAKERAEGGAETQTGQASEDGVTTRSKVVGKKKTTGETGTEETGEGDS